MSVLVCGGRYYDDAKKVDAVLRQCLPLDGVVIQGGANGADTLAKMWAKENGVHCATVPAQWAKYGKAAGMKRNTAMLNLKPALCVAFAGGSGTANMVSLCKTAGVPVIEVPE